MLILREPTSEGGADPAPITDPATLADLGNALIDQSEALNRLTSQVADLESRVARISQAAVGYNIQ